MKFKTILATCVVLFFVSGVAEARPGDRSPVRAWAGAEADKLVTGYSALEAFDVSTGRVVLNGKRYSLTKKTRFENEYGVTAAPKDFVAAESDGAIIDADSGSKVYFEIDRKSGRVRLLRLMEDLPS